jgi:excisionase family DNA binding protein
MPAERLLNAEEVARHVGMTPNWIYSETRNGRIPHIKLGRYRRYRPSAIKRWLEELEAGPMADVPVGGSADELGPPPRVH